MTLKNAKIEPYFQANKLILFEFGPDMAIVYSIIDHYSTIPGRQGYCWMSQPTIGELCCLNWQKVGKTLRRLEELELIRQVDYGDKRKRKKDTTKKYQTNPDGLAKLKEKSRRKKLPGNENRQVRTDNQKKIYMDYEESVEYDKMRREVLDEARGINDRLNNKPDIYLNENYPGEKI